MRAVFSLEVETQEEANAIFAMLREYQEQGVPLATTADGAEVHVREPFLLSAMGHRFLNALRELEWTDGTTDHMFEAFAVDMTGMSDDEMDAADEQSIENLNRASDDFYGLFDPQTDPNRDEKGNWIGNVQNENGWTP